jgi:hypothetical protein
VDVVIALVFFSLMLVAGALAFFISRLKEGDFEHGDRLSLLPLVEDDGLPLVEDDGLPPADDESATTEEDDPAHGSH